MGRLNRQTDIVRGVDRIGGAIRGSELLLTQTMSARIARAQKAIAGADAAAAQALADADAARDAAEKAKDAAEGAKKAAGDAEKAAGEAKDAAGDAEDAADTALAAAGTAEARSNVLAKTKVWRADPSTVSPEPSTGWAVIPEMSISDDFEGYHLFAFFSCDIQGSQGDVEIALFLNGVVLENTSRTIAATASISFSLVAQIDRSLIGGGQKALEAGWIGVAGGNLHSPGKRRQLSVLRVGTV